MTALRENEPDPIDASPMAVETYVLNVRDLLKDAADAGQDSLTEAQWHYLNEASRRQVKFAHAQLEHNRHDALEKLSSLFRLGTVPRPEGRYEGELVALSTGLLSDPFFEWLTRIYLPWQGKTFDAAKSSGDNVFHDNAWSKATEKIGWPGYRVPSDTPKGTVRVFPFKTHVGFGIEDHGVEVLKVDYADSSSPLPVRRMVDEIVELPGGYILGKTHMRGLREFRRVCYFGLFPAVDEA